jgi:hypothetical protein
MKYTNLIHDRWHYGGGRVHRRERLRRHILHRVHRIWAGRIRTRSPVSIWRNFHARLDNWWRVLTDFFLL